MFILDVVILFLMYLDTKVYNKIITPLTALLTPLMISLGLISIVEPKMSNIKLEVYLLIISFSWVILGLMIKIIFFMKNNKKKIQVFSRKFIKKMGMLIVFIVLISIVISAKKYGIGNLKGKLGGILTHIFILSSVFLSIELINKKGLIFKILYLLILILLLLIGGKYQVFLFVLPGFLLKMENEKKISLKILKRLILIIFLVFIIFGGVYYIDFYFKGMEININNFLKFILNHTKYYFLSPMFIGNKMLNFSNQGDFKIAFAPFVNIYEFILGNKNYINPILPYWISYDVKSNVGGLIPELVYSIGEGGMYIYITFLGLIGYILENMSSKHQIWSYPNLIFKSALILCFFSNVFCVLGYIERIIGSIVITMIIIILKKIKFIKRR